ncbi:hypothetical protein JCM9492_00360 [Aquifex pyrophilus]
MGKGEELTLQENKIQKQEIEQSIKEKIILNEFKDALKNQENILIYKCQKIFEENKPDFKCKCKSYGNEREIYIEVTLLPIADRDIMNLNYSIEKRDIEIKPFDKELPDNKELPDRIFLKKEGLVAEIEEYMKKRNLNNIRIEIQFSYDLFKKKEIFKGRGAKKKKEKFIKSLLEYIKEKVIKEEKFQKGRRIIKVKTDEDIPSFLKQYIEYIIFEKCESVEVCSFPIFSNKPFHERIKEVIQKKEAKKYKVSDPIWLVIKIEDNITQYKDAEEMFKLIKSETFERIYLLFEYEGGNITLIKMRTPSLDVGA